MRTAKPAFEPRSCHTCMTQLNIARSACQIRYGIRKRISSAAYGSCGYSLQTQITAWTCHTTTEMFGDVVPLNTHTEYVSNMHVGRCVNACCAIIMCGFLSPKPRFAMQTLVLPLVMALLHSTEHTETTLLKDNYAMCQLTAPRVVCK